MTIGSAFAKDAVKLHLEHNAQAWITLGGEPILRLSHRDEVQERLSAIRQAVAGVIDKAVSYDALHYGRKPATAGASA